MTSSENSAPVIQNTETTASNVASKHQNSSIDTKPESAPTQNISGEKTLLPAPTPTVNVWGKKKSFSNPSTSKSVLNWPTPKDATENIAKPSNAQEQVESISSNNQSSSSIRIKKTDKWVPFNANIVIHGSESKPKHNKKSRNNKTKPKNTPSSTDNGSSDSHNDKINHSQNDKESIPKSNNKSKKVNKSSPTGNGSSTKDQTTNVNVESKIEEINKQLVDLKLTSDKKSTENGDSNDSSPIVKDNFTASPSIINNQESFLSETYSETSENTFYNGDSDKQAYNQSKNQYQQSNNYNQNSNYKPRGRFTNNPNGNNNNRGNGYRNNYRNNGSNSFMPNYPFMVPYNGFNYGYQQQFMSYMNPQQQQQLQAQQANQTPQSKTNNKPATTDNTNGESPALQMLDPNVMYGPYVPYGYAAPIAQPGSQLNIVKQQISYYFSLENLLKDLYLRKLMDDEGAIKIEKLSEFNRVKILTGGDIDLLISAINSCEDLESLNNDEKVRVKVGWEKWILPKDQRI